MSELKNKSGVPIRVGQVWRILDDDGETEVIGVYKDLVWILVGCSLRFQVGPDNPYIHRLISDPIWGNMEEWRIVTEDERREYPMPQSSCEYWDLDEWRWCNCAWDDPLTYTYRVPRDFVFTKDEPQEPAPIEPIPCNEAWCAFSTAQRAEVLRQKTSELTDAVNELMKKRGE